MSILGSSCRNDNPFYDENDPQLDEKAMKILTDYSGISRNNIVGHVRSIREKAWEEKPYPCIGLYTFLDFGIKDNEQYGEILERAKAGESLLDVGCCFGQSLRCLIVDGVPPNQLYGLEIEKNFVDLGFELFKDKDRLQNQIHVGDIFELDGTGLAEHTFDIIHAGAFIHLFTWDEQHQVLCNMVRLLKLRSGSMIFGRQSGSQTPGPVAMEFARSGTIYRQNPSAFRNLIASVEETTAVALEVNVDLLGTIDKLKDDANGWRLLSFCITIK